MKMGLERKQNSIQLQSFGFYLLKKWLMNMQVELQKKIVRRGESIENLKVIYGF